MLNSGSTFGSGNRDRAIQRQAERSQDAVTPTSDGTGPPVNDWLAPVGDTGVYVSPNEPVSPNDCSRWRNSPQCSGPLWWTPPWRPQDIVQVPGIVGASANECEVCVAIEAGILGFTGPSYIVCYRSQECIEAVEFDRPLGSEPIQVNNEKLKQHFITPAVRQGKKRIVYTTSIVVLIHEFTITPRGADLTSELRRWIRQIQDETGPSIQNVVLYASGAPWALEEGHRSFARDPFTNLFVFFGQSMVSPDSVVEVKRKVDSGITVTAVTSRRIVVDNSWVEINCDSPTSLATEAENYFASVNFGSFYAEMRSPECSTGNEPPQPPPRKPTEEDDMGCNCDEITDLLAVIYRRLGCEQFPINVPETLYGKGQKTLTLEDYANVFAYSFRQLDSLLGEWPIDIEIEDEDPTTKGKQVRTLEIPNVAEALGEVFGLAYKNSISGDLSVEIGLRLAAEIIAAKNAALITQDYAKANASFLGYKGNPKKRVIDYAFDPENLDTFSKLLTESRKEIVGWQDEDSETVVSFLQRLMFAAGIIKAAFMRDDAEGNRMVDGIQEMLSDDLSQREGESWEDFVQRLNNHLDKINARSTPKPRAVNQQPGRGTNNGV